jgi:hypothetical protein
MKTTYYKALRPDLRSFYDRTTVWKLGEPMPPIEGAPGEVCELGYHLAKTIEDAVNYTGFPLRLFEAEPCGALLGENDKRARFTSVRIIREIPKPEWIIRVERFLDSLKTIRWFENHEAPREDWELFPTRSDAAKEVSGSSWDETRSNVEMKALVAAKRSGRGGAFNIAESTAGIMATTEIGVDGESLDPKERYLRINAARDAAEDALLTAGVEVVSDLPDSKDLWDYAWKRWEVWVRGYGLLRDEDGIFYVYRKP